MLSQADLAVCARDPDLPGLALMLDATGLECRAGLGSLTPTYLRYKPQTSCAAAFFTADGRAIAAYAFTPERYAEVRTRPKWRADPDVQLWDDVCLAIIPAQRDRSLRALRHLFDPRREPKLFRGLLGKQAARRVTGITLLRYKPDRRLVARLDGEGGPLGAMKIMSRAGFPQALAGASGSEARGGARLLGADGARCAIVTEWIDGNLLCPVNAIEIPDAEAVVATGRALASLHAGGFRSAFRQSPVREAMARGEIVSFLSELHPELGQLATVVARQLGRALAQHDPDRTLIHGDFSADQVVMRNGQPVILDWDRATLGDPAMDAGSFLARLDAQVIRGACPVDKADAMSDALLAGYAATAGAAPRGLALRQAHGLLMLATEPFRDRDPHWQDRTAALLDRAARLLDQPRARCPAGSVLQHALDPDRAESALAALLRPGAGDLELVAPPELIRFKPGRRAIVRYDLRQGGPVGGAASMLGKIRFKGLDKRTPKLHRALRRAGFDGCAGVGVPSVVGEIPAFGMWLQERVIGTSLAEFLTPDAATDPFARTGAALARLHAAPVTPPRNWSMTDESDILDRALARTAAARPSDGGICAAIAAAARARLATLPPADQRGIHRDFYFDQVIVAPICVWLVDLDLFARGDPSIDLGNFLAHLDEFGLRQHGDKAAFARHGTAFLDGYASVRALPADTRIAVLRAVSLARHIDISRRFADRRHTTDRLIAHAAAALLDKSQHERAMP
ncbi:phosphotransferase [Meridianimarinicoccus sp. RP-17]|uniref:phosphotransferase n=1 Tax=Meridianimarinicoccus zhengii TaxID=2056810 RepID=UPI0013A6B9E0|nr:phosphotransferase [Phycocomes zhengii]